MRFAPLILALVAAAAAPSARAGETACWVDRGVLVIPAEVLGIAGDYVLDTAAPRSLLAETRAQGAGFTATALRGEVRLAGLDLHDRAIAVADLDLRTGALPTPIAGVIGADILAAYVVDIRFAPCRVALWRPAQAPRFGRAHVLPLAWTNGAPTAPAAVSDGRRSLLGQFRPATGADTAVRLSDAIADAPGAAQRQELYPYGVSRPRLRALSLAGALYENLPAGLARAEDPAVAGEIGTPLLARYRLRFDFPRGRLHLAPAATKKGPG